MGKEVERCPHCNAKIVEYKHGLSKVLVRSLVKVAKRGAGAHRISEFLSKSEYTNFSKLQYWGLAEKADGGERGGVWKVTQLGLEFIKGHIQLRQYAWSYRGELVRFDGNRIYVMDVTGGWKYRPDYAREARPHIDPRQGDLNV